MQKKSDGLSDSTRAQENQMKEQDNQDLLVENVDANAVDALSTELLETVSVEGASEEQLEELLHDEKKEEEQEEGVLAKVAKEGVEVAAAEGGMIDLTEIDTNEQGGGAGSSGGSMAINPAVAVGLGVAGVVGVAAAADDGGSSGGGDKNDGPKGTNQKFDMTVTGSTVTEGDVVTAGQFKLMNFTLQLDGTPKGQVVAHVNASSSTAEQGIDYELVSDTVIFNEGQSTATVQVRVYGDEVPEGNDSIVLTVSSKNLKEPASGVGTIVDNDGFAGGSGIWILQETPATPVYVPGSTGQGLTWEGIPVNLVIQFLQDISAIDIFELGIIDDDGIDDGEYSNVTNVTVNPVNQGDQADSSGSDDNDDQSANAGSTVINVEVDGEVHSVEVDLGIEYLEYLRDLMFSENVETGDIDFTRLDFDEGEAPSLGTEGGNGPIVLTPSLNNGGSSNPDFTGDGDDLIVAGRVELVHEAYIDGGAGYNTLEIDGKGIYAQPLALINIQEVQIQNLPNVYTGEDSGEGDDIDTSQNQYPDLAANPDFADTVIDLSRAINIEKLVITEGFDTGLANGQPLGELTVVGVRNGALLSLEGGFSEDVNIHYGQGLGDSIEIDLRLGDVESDINLLHNLDVITINSLGFENHMEEFFAGGNISRMIVTGPAVLSIEDDLASSFNATRPAVIDASANTGGVDLVLTDEDQEEIRFVGSEGDDDVDFVAEKIVIDGGDGDNHYDLNGNIIELEAEDGDNTIHIDSLNGTINDVNGLENDFFVANVDIDLGSGDNLVEVVASVVGPNFPEPSAGSSELNQSEVNIETGGGDNRISVFANVVDIETGDGDDDISVGGMDITIDSDGGNDTVRVFGTNDDFEGSSPKVLIDEDGANQDATYGFDDGALLDIDMGSGENTLILGTNEFGDIYGFTSGGVVALSGSSITGSNITLWVDESSDLTAASLNGITRVVLDDDDSFGSNNAQLSLTAEQFAAIGADAFEVQFQTFGAVAHLEIVVTQDTTLTDLLDGETLSDNVCLNFAIAKDATLTLTAQQLHEMVASEGISVVEGFNGSVVITDAGQGFDPFQSSVGGLAVGSLSDDYFNSDDLTIIRSDNGFERPEPNDNEDQMVITNDGPDALVVGPIDLTDNGGQTDLILNGGGAFEFTGPVLLPENFLLDFSEAGAVSGLTIGNFHNITTDPDIDDAADWGQIIGNGIDGQRIDIHVGNDVGDPSDVNNGGFVSTGVDVYVVTELYDADDAGAAGPFNWDIATCVNTEVETLGLQGNYEDSIDYLNVERGIDFLLEVVYDKEFGYVVGDLGAHFAREGGDAVFNVVNIDAPMEDGEVQKLAGIDASNAVSVTLNITGGNTLLESTDFNEEVATYTVSGDGDVELPELDSFIANFDGSGIVGTLTTVIDLWNGEGENGPLVFEGAAGGTELTIDDAEVDAIASIDGVGVVNLMIGNGDGEAPDSVDLTGTTLGNIGTVSVYEGATLSVTLEQADAIGAADFLFVDDPTAGGDMATLNLVGLNDQPFSVADYAEEFSITLTLAEIPEVFINAATDFTGIDMLEIPEGTTLYLTMAQFQQLGNNSTGSAALTGAGSVVITDATQADVGENGEDLDLSAANIDIDGTVTVNAIEDLDLSEATMDLADLSAGGFTDPAGITGPSVDVFNIGGFTLTLGDINTADTTVVNGEAGSVLKFTDISEVILSRIDAAGFNVETLEVESALVADNNVDFMFDNLPEAVIKLIVDEFGQVVGRSQNVVIEETTTVPGALSFNDYGLDSEVIELNVTLGGGVLLGGDLIISTVEPADGTIASYLQELNIVSEGTEANTNSGETDNIISGDITPVAPFPGYDPDGAGDEFGPAVDNNLKLVNISATQTLLVDGAIIFSSHGADGNEPNDIAANDDTNATVTVNVSGSADVTVEQLDISDMDIGALVINNSGTGTFTVTGASPAIVTSPDSESVTVTGSGDVVLSDELAATSNTTLESDSVSVFDASTFTGNLSAGEFANVDDADFSFTAGTGVTTMTFTDDDLDSTGVDTIAGNADDTAGWNFDFSNAAAGSEFHFAPPAASNMADGSNLTFDMGANATLFIDTTMDLSDLDLSITSGQPIVVADGATLTLTAEQADGLTIIGENGAASTGVVNIVDLGDDPVDLSGVSTNIAGVATLEDDDVTLDVLTDLGFFAVQLEANVGGANDLSGQTIRFTTVAQAERDVLVVDEVGAAVDITLVNSTNVVWLFDDALADAIDTSGYFQTTGPDAYQIGRLWVNEDLLAANGGDVEDLFTTLPNSIVRAEFADGAALDDLLIAADAINRIFEVVSFMSLGDINFSDMGVEPDEFIESLTMNLGGQSTVGNVELDDELAPGTDPDSVVFNEVIINSFRALSDANVLATEFYTNDNDGIAEAGENALPDNINTVGNISVGASNNIDLLNVTLNTGAVSVEGDGSIGAGADLTVGDIIFDSEEPASLATLTLAGANKITAGTIDWSDPEITAFLMDVGGFTGVFDPVLDAGATGETFTIEDVGGSAGVGTIIYDDVMGAELSEIDGSGSDENVTMTISEIDSNDDGTDDAFTYTATTGLNDITLAGPTLEAGSTWNFDLSNAAYGSTVTIDAGTTLEPGSTLNVDLTFAAYADPSVAHQLVIDDSIDLTGVDLNVTGGTINVTAGNTLTLTVEQLADLFASTTPIIGEGTVVVTGDGTDANPDIFGVILTQNADLSAVTIDTDGLNGDDDATGALEITGAQSAANLDIPFAELTFTPDDVADGDEFLSVTYTVAGLAGAGSPVAVDLTLVDVTDAEAIAAAVAAALDAEGDIGAFAEGGLVRAFATPATEELEITDVSVSAGTTTTLAADVVNAPAFDGLGGISWVGSAEDDVIDGGARDDVFTMGAGDDTITGDEGSDTFNVDEGTDTITDLTTEPDDMDPLTEEDQDVLVVSNGATAMAMTDGFIATSDTMNAGTAVITGNDGAPVTINMFEAGGPNGYMIVGNTDDVSTLSGSMFDDVINGGDGPQDGGDILTGNGGDDHFVFNVIISDPASFASVIDTAGEDEETFTITADGGNEGDEVINVNYQLNNNVSSLVVNLGALGVDPTDATAVATAIANAFNNNVNGITASSNAADVTLVGDQVGGTGNFVEFTGIAANAGTIDTLAGAEAGTSDDNDVAQQSTVTLDFGGGTATAGEVYTLTVALRNGTDIVSNQVVAAGGETEAQIVTQIVNQFNAVDGGTNVLADQANAADAFFTLVVDPAGQEDATGGFVASLTTEAAFGGSGASAGPADMVDISVDGLGAVDPDYITDFVTGDDMIAIGDLDSSDYDEANTASADFSTAITEAEAAFVNDSGTNVYFTFVENQDDPTTTGVVENDVTIGYLVFDVTDDDIADGVIAMIGIDDTMIGAGDIEPYAGP